MSTPSDINDLNSKNSPPIKPRWEELYDEMTADPLQKVRDTAEKWTNVVSALVGISTIFGLIQGRDALDKLSSITKFYFVAMFILTLLSAIGAIYLAALASEGTPKGVIYEEEAFTSSYIAAKDRAISNLKQSRILALIAIIFLIIALCISWFGAKPLDIGTNILAVQKSGKVICGTLVKDNTGNLLLIRTNLKPLALNDIVSFNIVSNCP